MSVTVNFQGEPQEHPTFIQIVRLYRAECDLSFEEAKQRAIREFKKRGWELPDTYRN